MSRKLLLVLTAFLCLYAFYVRAGTVHAVAPEAPAEPGRLYLPYVSNEKPTTVFGVQMYAPLEDRRQFAPAATFAGVSWVRWPVGWAAVEPYNTKPSNYDYSSLDRSIQEAAALHLNIIATIGGNPPWAATYSHGPIDLVPLGEFGQFVQALVERYDGDGFHDAPGSPVIKIWEFYNEPDGGSILGAELGSPYWGDFGKQYAAMLCTAYTAAKSADRATKIALGGIAYDWFREDGGPFVRNFLEDVLANGGGKCMDYMNFHYYPFFQARWEPYGHGMAGKTNYLRSRLAAYGVGALPMIVTEAGHHSNNYVDYPSTPQEQANYVVKLFTQSIATQIRLMIWWTWIDLPGYWGENGLLTTSGNQKPAYTAYRVAAARLGQARFVREVPATETGSSFARVYQFDVSSAAYVVWAEGATTTRILLRGSRYALITPEGILTGYALDSADGKTDGRVTIDLGEEPRYLERVD